ncbi:phosphate:acyl-[acyl carrier protein] acyltransferase, partial [Caldanaerobius fijiensis DSM 17918]
SAGNTGALMAGALMVVGRIKGIKRPALAPIIPTRTGNMLIIDAGSNTDCDEENLMQFARMGSIYCSYVLDIENPRVGIFNIGSEPGKGNEVTKKVYKLLELSDLNFVGNIEGRDIPFGKADVLVCDGFVGNAILKSMEGIALFLLDMMKEELMRNWVTRMCALVLKDGFKRIAKKMDYSEYGGAPLLGINGACIKAHGTSNAKTIKNAIFQARKYVSGGVIDYIHKEILSGVDISG